MRYLLLALILTGCTANLAYPGGAVVTPAMEQRFQTEVLDRVEDKPRGKCTIMLFKEKVTAAEYAEVIDAYHQTGKIPLKYTMKWQDASLLCAM